MRWVSSLHCCYKNFMFLLQYLVIICVISFNVFIYLWEERLPFPHSIANVLDASKRKHLQNKFQSVQSGSRGMFVVSDGLIKKHPNLQGFTQFGILAWCPINGTGDWQSVGVKWKQLDTSVSAHIIITIIFFVIVPSWTHLLVIQRKYNNNICLKLLLLSTYIT